MQTLSLFSGCGLFDHAFKATGFTEIVFAIDCFEMAIRSHQANDPDKKTRCEIGSVYTFLSKIASGQEPMIAVDCIIAGCPCQGFSTANNHRQNRKGQKNCSLLANLLSWIEIFMPAYVAIENVPAMDSPQSAACALAKSHLVSLGYQVRQDVYKVSELEGATQRKRLIIVAAAPGAILPDAVPRTHGKGLAEVRTAGDVMRLADLPPLHNDKILNIKMPNHIPADRLSVDLDNEVSRLKIVQQIPTRPVGMSLVVAYNQGLFSRTERRWIRSLNEPQQAKGSKSFKRINPDQPFQTITTKVNLHCCKMGQLLHPVEHRALSLQEIRLAFDVPDSFILVGKVADQVKMLGNSVPWNLGASVGRQIGRCWSASLAKRASAGTAGPAGVTIEKEPDTAGQKISVVIPRTAPQRRRARPVVEDESDGDSGSSIEYLGARPVKKARAE
jgi:DNA (cytosine-5)-methyltransferase 1